MNLSRIRAAVLAGVVLIGGPAHAQVLGAYVDTIPGTLVTFSMTPVAGGATSFDTPAGTSTVTVPPFWIGSTEVTWDMYDVYAFRLDVPREQRAGIDATTRPSRPYGAPDRGFGHAGFPAISMTHAAAVGFASWLSAKTGRQYAVATEAQWMRAAEAARWSSASPAEVRARAWSAEAADGRTHAVATRAADPLGLYDMLGNAAEWVTAADGNGVVRGGSYLDPAAMLGPSRRTVPDPSWNQTDPQVPPEPVVALGRNIHRLSHREDSMRLDRRTFIHAGAVTAAGLALPRPAFGIGRPDADPIRIGLVGCGGRGTGAARDALSASENVRLVALGDIFADRLAKCRDQLGRVASENAGFASKYGVTSERCFTGLDAFRQVLAADIDLVLLCTPPGFRPQHLEAAIAAGKHVFMEKPVCVDVAGALSVIRSSAAAASRNLAIVAGTQRRHDPLYIETIKRIHDGAIGRVVSGQVYWNQGGLWNEARQPAWSDGEWQLRNWLYFTWASGDHIVEQHVHNLDVANWVLDALPVKAVGIGGRQARTGPEYGHIYDHFAIQYEYPNGVHVTSMCRQQDGTASLVAEQFTGTAGSSNGRNRINGATAWTHPGAPGVNPYVEEHRDLVASIRAGTPLNQGKRIAESTLTAIMGREAAYTGQEVTWTQLIAADQDIGPKPFALAALPVPPVAMPGQTRLARTFVEGWVVMRRRDFVVAATAATAAHRVARPAIAQGAVSAPVPFHADFAPHFGMFRAHAGEDPIAQLRWMHERGFRSLEDNGMRGRETAEQERIGAEMTRLGMRMGVFVLNPSTAFGKVTFAAGEQSFADAFLADVRASIDVARRVNAKWMTVVMGDIAHRLEPEYQTANAVEILRRGAELLEPHGLVMVLEPLNRRDHPGMFLSRIPHAFQICRAVDSPACKILFDIYHQQITEGNLIPNFDRAWTEVAYVQIGDNPGRKEPGTGEINYANIFTHIKRKGYTGVLGMEHGNAKPGVEGELAVIDAYRKVDPIG